MSVSRRTKCKNGHGSKLGSLSRLTADDTKRSHVPRPQSMHQSEDGTVMSDHHRLPRSLGGKTTPENISVIPIVKHRAWHVLFKNYPAEKIVEIINKHYLDPAVEFRVFPRKRKVRR